MVEAVWCKRATFFPRFFLHVGQQRMLRAQSLTLLNGSSHFTVTTQKNLGIRKVAKKENWSLQLHGASTSRIYYKCSSTCFNKPTR